MGEGIYTGVSGNAKQLWKKIEKYNVRDAFAGFGKFLYEEYKSENADDLAKELKDVFSKQEHSGGSALVAIQQVMDVFGARCLSEVELKYIREKNV